MGLSYIDVFAFGRNTVYELIKKTQPKEKTHTEYVCIHNEKRIASMLSTTKILNQNDVPALKMHKHTHQTHFI